MRGPEIHPAATDAEAAAIVAAIAALWPTSAVTEYQVRSGTPTWRFSGRWWQRDRLAPRDRPWT